MRLAMRRDPGGDDVLQAYAGARRLDVLSRTVGVDLLNRSLLTSLVPLQAARGIVLHGLKALPLCAAWSCASGSSRRARCQA